MMLWHLMREAAIIRHHILWVACGSHPDEWEPHMDVIRMVYGY